MGMVLLYCVEYYNSIKWVRIYYIKLFNREFGLEKNSYKSKIIIVNVLEFIK